MKILIAEDNRELLSTLKRALVRFDIDSDTVFDGVQAIDKLNNNSYDLLLLDLRMPRMDGIKVCNIAKENYKDLPIVMMTSISSDEIHELTSKIMADDYFSKPFSVIDLKDHIVDIVKLRKTHKPIDIFDFHIKLDTLSFLKEKEVKITYNEYLLIKEFIGNECIEDIALEHLIRYGKLNDYINSINAKLLLVGSEYQIKKEKGFKMVMTNV